MEHRDIRTDDAVSGNTYGKSKWAILLTVLVMTFMVCLDSSIVNVALPILQRELDVGLDQIQWVSSVYLVVTCAIMLVFGRLGDMYGKVWLFQGGVALFTVGSLLCGLSSTLMALVAARAVQGIGCAAAMANNMGIITESFPARERGRALGILASFVALGLMVGPVLGGLILAALPWECIFLINVPVGITSLLVGFKTLPHVRPDHAEMRLDIRGSALLVPGIVLTFCAITLIQNGLTAALVALLVAGIALLAAFVWVERRVEQPLARLSVFRDATFTVSFVTMLICFIAVGASEGVLPFYLQDARDFPTNVAGLVLAVIPLVNAVVGPLSGALSDRIGAVFLTTVGLAVDALGLVMVGLLGETSPLVSIVAAMGIMSLGESMFIPPNNALIMASTPRDALGFAGSLGGLSRYMGMAIGITVGISVLYGQMAVAAGERVTGYVAGRPDIFLYGYRWVFMVLAALVAVGFVLSAVRFVRLRRAPGPARTS